MTPHGKQHSCPFLRPSNSLLLVLGAVSAQKALQGPLTSPRALLPGTTKVYRGTKTQSVVLS